MGAYLTGELAAHNETYGLVSSVFSLLKNRQPSDQKYEQTILGAAKRSGGSHLIHSACPR